MQIIKSSPNVLLSGWSNKRFFFLVGVLALHLQLISVSTVAQYTKVVDFGYKDGAHPSGSLISDGTFLYGMTVGNGAYNLGTIFKIKPDGSGYSTLLNFNGAVNGGHPFGSLILEGGSLYGITATGGTNNWGTIFKIKPDGTGYSKLWDFDGANSGGNPEGSLVSDGTFLYGTTMGGGEFASGTLFKIKPDGTGFSTMYEFKGISDGWKPFGSLIVEGGFLYGVTSFGGAYNKGTIFKIQTDATGFITLYEFEYTPLGNVPYGDLLSDGKFLYGMTSSGGANGHGTIFKIQLDGTGFEIVLDLLGPVTGSSPNGSLIFDGTFLYGMTSYYGKNEYYGTIFKIKPDGSGFVTLLDFDGSTTGSTPYGSLISDGTFLYGMTSQGGKSSLGMVFKIKTDGSGYNMLHQFYTGGNSPYGSLISDGTSLYGMTAGGGANDYGTIFKVDTDGTGYTNLLDFDNVGNGSYPQGSLFFDGTFLYGMANSGGANYSGTIFKIKPDGTGYAKIFDFNSSIDGGSPYGSLISDGTFLYGTTSYGSNSKGTIFKIKPDGSGYVTLSDFNSTGAGSTPHGDLLYDGNFLYGTTLQGGANGLGTIFKLKTDGSTYTTVFDFGASSDGHSPYGALISDGTFLYGMTRSGGMGGGTLFKIARDGKSYVKLRNFVGIDIFDGSSPYGSLSFDGTFLYGLTAYGGQNDLGTLFKMKPDGSEYTKLLDFDGSQNGRYPQGSLLQIGSSLYGMTQLGGINADLGGTIFKYAIPNPCSDVVTITATSTELTASSGDSYQWYYFGNAISGETNQSLSYDILEYGEYAVDVMKSGCTYYTSYNYLITGQQHESNASVQVFPNPFKENLIVNLPEADYSLKVIDQLGRTLFEQRGTKGSNELKTSGLTSGFYYLIAKSHDDVIVFKIQKL